MEAAARREVQEETGLRVEAGPPISSIRYWFAHDEVLFHKTVHFFLMCPVGGALEEHDAEFDVVQWFPLEEACGALSYQNEVEVVRRVEVMLSESGMKC
jgi:8-oxo-dGTP pyrophosphatase MutT (NUDIX family)